MHSLLPATYQLAVTAQGFAPLTVRDVRLGSGEQRTLDLYLKGATVRESVTISAEADATVQTNSASIQSRICR